MKRIRTSSRKDNERKCKRLKMTYRSYRNTNNIGTIEPEDIPDHNCEDCDYDFHLAIFDNNIRKIKQLLLENEDLCVEKGLNCFMITHLTQNWPLLERFLILKPEGVHARDENGCTLFLLNAHRLEILRLLLKYGSDPHVSTNYGNALTYAINHNAPIECVEFLLNLHIDIHEEDMYGKTALTYATIYGRSDVVKLLLQHGANPNFIDNQGNSALLYAARHHTENIIPVIHLLLHEGADLHFLDANGRDALTCSIVSSKCINIVTTLIQAGSDLNRKDKYGWAPLFYAMKSESPEFALKSVVELLLGGSDVNITDFEGNTALIEACRMFYPNSEVEMIQNLLDFGANPNACNIFGYTPLMAACASLHYPKRLEIIKELLKVDIDITAKDNHEYNAVMHLCEQTGNPKLRYQILKELLNKNIMCGIVSLSAVQTPLSVLTKSPNCDPIILMELLKITADPFLVDEEGCTPIFNIVETYFKASKSERGNLSQCIRILYDKAEKMRKSFNFIHQDLQMHPQSLLLQNFSYLDFKEQFPIYSTILNSTFTNKKMTIPEYFTLPENLEEILETNLFEMDAIGCYFKSAMEHVYTEDVTNVIHDILWPLERLHSYGYHFNESNPTTLSPLTILLSFNIDLLAANSKVYEPQPELPENERIIDQEIIDPESDMEDQFTDLLMYFITKRGANVAQRMLRFSDKKLQQLSDELQLPDALWVATIASKLVRENELLTLWIIILNIFPRNSYRKMSHISVFKDIYIIYNELKI
jgi:ankyrin repeat protein